jgi:hypothetical protein
MTLSSDRKSGAMMLSRLARCIPSDDALVEADLDSLVAIVGQWHTIVSSVAGSGGSGRTVGSSGTGISGLLWCVRHIFFGHV